MSQNLIGVNGLSEILGVPSSWIYARTRLKGKEQIPCIRCGKYIRFRIDEVMEWLQRQNENN
jgi:predicted DNA-binding transcriptional regulator AlpA